VLDNMGAGGAGGAVLDAGGGGKLRKDRFRLCELSLRLEGAGNPGLNGMEAGLSEEAGYRRLELRSLDPKEKLSEALKRSLDPDWSRRRDKDWSRRELSNP